MWGFCPCFWVVGNNFGWRVSACTDFPGKYFRKFLAREKSFPDFIFLPEKFSGFYFLTGKVFPEIFLAANNYLPEIFLWLFILLSKQVPQSRTHPHRPSSGPRSKP